MSKSKRPSKKPTSKAFLTCGRYRPPTITTSDAANVTLDLGVVRPEPARRVQRLAPKRPCWEIVRCEHSRTIKGSTRWHARLIARNGRVICWTESYTTKRAALNAVRVAQETRRIKP